MKISHSALQVFLECRYKYFLSYMLKLRPKVKRSPLAFGDSIDVGLNHLLLTKDLAGAINQFQTSWLTYKDIDIVFSKSDLEEHLFKPDEDPNAWESLNRRGIILLEEFNQQIIPHIKEVIAVQINKQVKNDTNDELVIKTDFICIWEDGRRILFDNKTSSQKYAADSVRTSEQLAIYYEMLKEEYKLDAAGYIVIPKKINKRKKPLVNIEVIIDSIDEETIIKTLESYDKALIEIKNANFKQNHGACMGKYGRCDYYSFCHQNGKLDGLEYK